MDKAWWDVHLAELNRSFAGQRYSSSNLGAEYQATYLPTLNAYANSGAGCISLALFGDAQRVIMLGFDCQHTEGKAHWHGNHPSGLGNARQTERWPALFAKLRADHPGAHIINASRTTALACFERMDLENAIAETAR